MSTCERCDALIAAARELIRAVEAEVPLLGIPSGDGKFIDLSAWDGSQPCDSPHSGPSEAPGAVFGDGVGG